MDNENRELIGEEDENGKGLEQIIPYLYVEYFELKRTIAEKEEVDIYACKSFYIYIGEGLDCQKLLEQLSKLESKYIQEKGSCKTYF